MPISEANTPFLDRIYKQPPNHATVAQRQANLVEMGLTERNEGGRTRRFRFEEPTDKRPARLADNLDKIGELWQEWECGIAGGMPAKSFRDDTKRLCSSDKKKFSRRKPIYQLLESVIVYKKCVPAEAFRLVESHLGKHKMGKLAKLIRDHVSGGTMPPALFVRSCQFGLKQCTPPSRSSRRPDPGCYTP